MGWYGILEHCLKATTTSWRVLFLLLWQVYEKSVLCKKTGKAHCSNDSITCCQQYQPARWDSLGLSFRKLWQCIVHTEHYLHETACILDLWNWETGMRYGQARYLSALKWYSKNPMKGMVCQWNACANGGGGRRGLSWCQKPHSHTDCILSMGLSCDWVTKVCNFGVQAINPILYLFLELTAD